MREIAGGPAGPVIVCAHQAVNSVVSVVIYVSDALWMCIIEWNNGWLRQRNPRLPV